MPLTKIMIALATPAFVLAVCLAYKREVRVPGTVGNRIVFITMRVATAPRAAGMLLLASLVLGGAALVLRLLGGP